MAQGQSLGYCWILVFINWQIVCYRAAAVLPPAEHMVQILPNIETFTTALGNSVVLSCSLNKEFISSSNGSLLELMWKDNHGQQVNSNLGKIYVEVDGLYTKKLYITSITAADAGKYTCQILHNGESRSRSVTLALYKPITFDRFPTSLHPVLHTDTFIDCIVSGTPMPNVTWKYNGQRIHYSDNKYIESDNGLKILNVSFEDEGNYTCRAEVESEGRYSERTIHLVVHVQPRLREVSLRMEGVAGQSMSLSCKADGFPAPAYKFFKGNTQVPLVSSERVDVDTAGGSVLFQPVLKEDAGVYRCAASNAAGSVSDSGTVTILVPPSIVSVVNGLANEGDDAHLECQSTGDPAPSVTFRRRDNVSDIDLTDNERVTVTNPSVGGARMTLRQVTSSDSGNYSCVASSSLGIVERSISLVVSYAPRFSANYIADVYTKAGQTVNLTCSWEAEPVGRVAWWRRGKVIANDNTYRIVSSNNTSVLQVTVHTHLQARIYDRYTCQVANTLGSASADRNLRRATAPDVPDDVKVLETSPTEITLKVTPPSEDGGMTVTGYRVEYSAHTNEFPLGSDMVLHELKPGSNYSLRVSAVNEVGVGIPMLLTARTDDATVPSPVKITAPQHSPHAYEHTLTWDVPYFGGMPIESYLIRYRLVEDLEADGTLSFKTVHGDWQSFEETQDVDFQLTSYKVIDLKSNSLYQAEVLAHNEVGWSSPGSLFTFRTAVDPNVSTVSAGDHEASPTAGEVAKLPEAIGDSHSTADSAIVSCGPDGPCSTASLLAISDSAYTVLPVESREEAVQSATTIPIIVIVVLVILVVGGGLFVYFTGIYVKFLKLCNMNKHQVHNSSANGDKKHVEPSEKNLLENGNNLDSLEMKNSSISEKQDLV